MNFGYWKICYKFVTLPKADMLIALYRTEFRTHRWYMSIFSHLLDLCVSNAWLLYRREHEALKTTSKLIPLKDFRNSISNSLLKFGRSGTKRKRNSTDEQLPEAKQRKYSSKIWWHWPHARISIPWEMPSLRRWHLLHAMLKVQKKTLSQRQEKLFFGLPHKMTFFYYFILINWF